MSTPLPPPRDEREPRVAERVVCVVVSWKPCGGADSSPASQVRNCGMFAPVSAMITWPRKFCGRRELGSFARNAANICAESTGTTLTTSLRGYSGKSLGFFAGRDTSDVSRCSPPPCPHAQSSVPAISAAPNADGHDLVMRGGIRTCKEGAFSALRIG